MGCRLWGHTELDMTEATAAAAAAAALSKRSAYTDCKQQAAGTARAVIGLGVEFFPQEVFRTEEMLLF